MTGKPKTVAEYFGRLPIEQRRALQKLRESIRGAAPDAEECISYALPAFRHNGRVLAIYGAWTNHCSLYPGPEAIAAHRLDLKGYEVSKGAICFPLDRPMPKSLVKKLLKPRLADNLAKTPAKRKPGTAKKPRRKDVEAALADLKRLASKKTRDEMGPRYGIHTDKAFGVKVGDIQSVAKKIGKSHELADALWKTGWYEARMLASFIDEVDRVTPAQMDRWRRDFDNWGICDTVCFKLFDQTPHALAKVREWAKLTDEFGKRAAFALLACVALHNKELGDEEFARCLPLVEKGAADERNFVKKGVSWALRAIGGRNPSLRSAALAVAERLADSKAPAARWVGKDALRDLNKKI